MIKEAREVFGELAEDADSAKLNELAARQQECRERLETCYETWEDLSMQLDGAKDS